MELRRRGQRFVARCAFADHIDSTPSFTVSADGRLWRCHGCGRGGDLFTFGMEWFGAQSFVAAVELIVIAMGSRLEAFRDAPARAPRQGVARVA
jgi:DNA primase